MLKAEEKKWQDMMSCGKLENTLDYGRWDKV